MHLFFNLRVVSLNILIALEYNAIGSYFYFMFLLSGNKGNIYTYIYFFCFLFL